MGKENKQKVKRIVLIGCGKGKREERSKIRDLYTGTLFKFNLIYAEMHSPDAIYVLSAKHKLIELDTKVEPYDQTLNNMRSEKIRDWADDVLEQLKQVADLKKDKFIFLAGDKYRKYIVPYIKNYVVPLKGLGIGSQMGFLKRWIEKHGGDC